MHAETRDAVARAHFRHSARRSAHDARVQGSAWIQGRGSGHYGLACEPSGALRRQPWKLAMRIHTCSFMGGMALILLVRCELGEEERSSGAGFANSFAVQGQERACQRP